MKKFAKTIVAILVAIIVLCLCLQVWAPDKYKPSEWFNKSKTEQNETPNENAIISDGESDGGMTIASKRIDRANYAKYNVAPQAESAYTLTATILPASADNKAIDWSAAWENSASAWATGKNVSIYVSLSASGNTCIVSCLKDFGEQIIITATSQDNSEAYATCAVDYVQRITGFTFNMPNITSETTSFTYSVEYSDYTIEADVSIEMPTTVELTAALQSKIQELAQSSGLVCAIWPANMSSSLNGSNGTITIDCNDEDLMANGFVSPSGLTGCFFVADRDDMREEGFSTSDMIYCFRQAVNAVSGAHITFDINYSTTYNGTTYSSGTKTVQGRFDGSALHIPVESLSLNSDSIVF